MNLRSISIPTMTLVIGFAMGSLMSDAFHRQEETFLEKKAPIEKGDIAIRALRLVRNGDTNTIGFLQTQIDLSISELYFFYKAHPKNRWDQNAIKVIGLVKEDRTRFPWRSADGTLNQEVDEVFALTPK